jgi:hypothetical protein
VIYLKDLMATMMLGWVVVVVLLLLLVASLAPVLTDNLSRFYAKAVRRLDKLIACTAVGAGYDLSLYRIRRYLDLRITFWTLYHVSNLLLCWI